MSRQSRHISSTRKIVELIISWLIPGSGFVLHRDFFRGIAIFFLLGLTFFLGILLKGTVVFPELNPAKTDAFNVINILTFLAQMGYGGLSLLCLGSKTLGLHAFQGRESYGFFDLASFYLIVAGGLNYLMLFNFYDRHLREEKKGSSESES